MLPNCCDTVLREKVPSTTIILAILPEWLIKSSALVPRVMDRSWIATYDFSTWSTTASYKIHPSSFAILSHRKIPAR